MHRFLRKPSPAMVVACLALFVVSTGTSIAANHYLITSTKQIKPSVIKKLKGAKGAKGARGATGVAGAAGAAGVAGARGVAGAAGATHVVKRWAVGTSDATISGAIASCNAGEVATGGGTDWSAKTLSAIPVVSLSAPTPYGLTVGTPTGWRGDVTNVGTNGTVTVLVWVICASP